MFPASSQPVTSTTRVRRAPVAQTGDVRPRTRLMHFPNRWSGSGQTFGCSWGAIPFDRGLTRRSPRGPLLTCRRGSDPRCREDGRADAENKSSDALTSVFQGGLMDPLGPAGQPMTTGKTAPVPAVPTPPSPGDVRAELEHVVTGPAFAQSDRLVSFLRFIVNETLAGGADHIKESVVGVEIFGRPPGYDPKGDPIVRVQARHLRQKLRDHYDVARRDRQRADRAAQRRIRATVPARTPSLAFRGRADPAASPIGRPRRDGRGHRHPGPLRRHVRALPSHQDQRVSDGATSVDRSPAVQESHRRCHSGVLQRRSD